MRFAPLLPLLCLMGLVACGEPQSPSKDLDAAVIYQEVEGWQVMRLSKAAESAHPYLPGQDQAQALVVRAPAGALEMKLLFDELDVEPGHDEVSILDGEGRLVQTLTGQFKGWSEPISGDQAVVLLRSDASVQGYGFKVSALQFRQPQLEGQWRHHALGAQEQLRTEHPYQHDQHKTWTLEGPRDAQALRVRFSDFSLERGYDFVNLYDAQGAQVASYTGRKGPFVSAPVPGHQVTVELITDGSVNDYGFEVAALDVLTTQEDEAGCRDDDDCGAGQRCKPVQCIQAPCPALCVPDELPPRFERCTTNADCDQDQFCEPLRCLSPPCDGRCLPRDQRDPAHVAEACTSERPCAPDASCVEDLAGPRDQGVCAAPMWSRHQALPHPVASEHPYADNQEQRFEIQLPSWVRRFSLHLDNVDLEEGYDFLHLYADGQQEPMQSWTGSPGDVITDMVVGHRAELRLVADYSVGAYGFEASRVDTWGLPQQLVSVTYEPQQCAQGQDNPRNSRELRSYMRRRGLTLYGVRVFRAHRYTCQGCHCPTGHRYVMAMSPADAATFLAELPLAHKGLRNDHSHYQPQQAVHRLSISPKQCGGNPWQLQADPESRGPQEEPAQLQRYLEEAFGVRVLYSWSQDSQRLVCQACSCPRGDLLQVVVEASDEQLQAMKEAGWAR